MSSVLVRPVRRAAALALTLLIAGLGTASAAPADTRAALPGAGIVAVVNRDIISKDDVDSRARLFAMSTGLPLSEDVVTRLRPQILRQLVDERLRIQEIQARKIVVSDKDIASTIRDIETRNHMPAGMLRQKLVAGGASQRTLIDQIRSQLGWAQVLREALGTKLNITESDIDEQVRLRAQATGQEEFRIGEIFIPIHDPANTADSQRFAETVIHELRAGAPFPMVAAQFSQTQTALEGGEVGWVQASQVDPEVGRLLATMPVGAVSNPVKVAGGFSIVMLQGKRAMGQNMATALRLRQAFLAFTTPLNPANPTDEQKRQLDKARTISATVHSCDEMEAVAKTVNTTGRPIDPGELRLEGVAPPPFRELLSKLPIGKATQPLVASDGIAILTVCSREQKVMTSLSRQDIQRQMINERVELLSRQLLRDMRRQAHIDIRGQSS